MSYLPQTQQVSSKHISEKDDILNSNFDLSSMSKEYILQQSNFIAKQFLEAKDNCLTVLNSKHYQKIPKNNNIPISLNEASSMSSLNNDTVNSPENETLNLTENKTLSTTNMRSPLTNYNLSPKESPILDNSKLDINVDHRNTNNQTDVNSTQKSKSNLSSETRQVKEIQTSKPKVVVEFLPSFETDIENIQTPLSSLFYKKLNTDGQVGNRKGKEIISLVKVPKDMAKEKITKTADSECFESEQDESDHFNSDEHIQSDYNDNDDHVQSDYCNNDKYILSDDCNSDDHNIQSDNCNNDKYMLSDDCNSDDHNIQSDNCNSDDHNIQSDHCNSDEHIQSHNSNSKQESNELEHDSQSDNDIENHIKCKQKFQEFLKYEESNKVSQKEITQNIRNQNIQEKSTKIAAKNKIYEYDYHLNFKKIKYKFSRSKTGYKVNSEGPKTIKNKNNSTFSKIPECLTVTKWNENRQCVDDDSDKESRIETNYKRVRRKKGKSSSDEDWKPEIYQTKKKRKLNKTNKRYVCTQRKRKVRKKVKNRKADYKYRIADKKLQLIFDKNKNTRQIESNDSAIVSDPSLEQQDCKTKYFSSKQKKISKRALNYDTVSDTNLEKPSNFKKRCIIEKVPKTPETPPPITKEQECGDEKRSQRKLHGLNFDIPPGNGVYLENIEYIAKEIEGADDFILIVFHNILYNVYGSYINKEAKLQTKRNILRFNGFPFEADSPQYEKKSNFLMRLPYDNLCEISNIIHLKPKGTRSEIVEKILAFLLKPISFDYGVIKQKSELNPKEKLVSVTSDSLKNEDQNLKNDIILGKTPKPVVILKRMTKKDLKIILNENEFCSSSELSGSDYDEHYSKSPYVINGEGEPLKNFKMVKKRIQRVSDHIVSLLHQIMYGTCENDHKQSRINILHFTGFTRYHENYILRQYEFLSHLELCELKLISSIFSLNTNNLIKLEMIEQIMKFLKCPSKKILKENEKMPSFTNKLSNVKSTKSNTKEILLDNYKHKAEIPNVVLTENSTELPPNNEENIINVFPSIKLRDFPTICSNIECATPEDVSELSDILFVKPSDNSEIHQQILDFTPFTFNESSVDYHYRKTLMHYMNFDVIKKIAQLLDIANWDQYSNQDELAKATLKFLMEMKSSNSNINKKNPIKCTYLQQKESRPLIVQIQPENDKIQKAKSENFSSLLADHLYFSPNHSSTKKDIPDFDHLEESILHNDINLLHSSLTFEANAISAGSPTIFSNYDATEKNENIQKEENKNQDSSSMKYTDKTFGPAEFHENEVNNFMDSLLSILSDDQDLHPHNFFKELIPPDLNEIENEVQSVLNLLFSKINA